VRIVHAMKNKTATFLMGVGLMLIYAAVTGELNVGMLVGWIFGYIFLSGVENERTKDSGIPQRTE
jgi:hypothetical protein